MCVNAVAPAMARANERASIDPGRERAERTGGGVRVHGRGRLDIGHVDTSII